ncbi:MAG: acetylxylan esterase [Phycisphaerae bacterium]|jgi:hypothetical protein|nr:acetylxylan esterase [Phycisphaerae bacterium]
MKFMILIGLVTVLSAMSLAAAKVELCRGNYHSEAAARKQLAKFAGGYSDLAGWKKRAATVRQGMLRGMGLDSPPKKCDLKPIITNKRTRKGYTVENVAFESLPGFFVTGNLYRPIGAKAKSCAGILSPHGHFRDRGGDGGGRFRPSMQTRCATLARMGTVVLSMDMVGWGEATQYPHRGAKTLTLQTWNGIRAIDFLYSLKEVDPKRIGITGASGGGTQTFVLTAVDDRVSVSIPCVMVSAHFFGGCSCESGMPIHKSAAHETNNADIAALAAPRPQLLISNGKDWTKNTPKVEMPYIKNVYKLCGAESKVANLHLAKEGHDYGPSKRNGAYAFFAKHLKLKAPGDEGTITIEDKKTLTVFTDESPRPKHAVKGAGAVEALLKSTK